jgi:hypothetical protein
MASTAMENIATALQPPLAIEFELLWKALERAAEAEAEQQQLSTPISIGGYATRGKGPTKITIDFEAVLDTSSEYNTISKSACDALGIRILSSKDDDRKVSAPHPFPTLNGTIRVEARVPMRCSRGTLYPSGNGMEFLVPSEHGFSPDVILGRKFADEYLMLHRHCLTRLKLWANDIGDKHIAKELSAGHVLQALDDSDAAKSRQLVEELRGVFNVILNLLGTKHKINPAFEVLR